MKISKTKINRILTTLDKLYPFDGRCFLNYTTPWQLLFATVLSAQCTDDRVNQVTAVLFEKFPTLESFAQAELADLEEIIHPTGFFRAKSMNIKKSAIALITEHNSHVPSDIDALTGLAGVGRKTANVVRSHIFKIPSIVVDTHVMRVSYRLELTDYKDPTKIEFDLMEKLPEAHWIRYNQQVISHGRATCKAQSPRCDECELRDECREME
ncbi:MAG: endonuclease III [Defluviitaleaceae bacterium]|nr:endonuclease III [Defluviitaleaceae bacterium]